MSTHSLIVGGTRGIGRELARIFREQDHTVSVIGRRAPVAADQSQAGVHFWITDLADAAALAAALEEIVQRHGRVNNVVFFQRYRGEGDKWAGEVATSLTATKNVIELLTDQFAETGVKSIVMVGSIASDHIAGEQPVGYHVAKAGLHQMACYYAVTLGPKGIRVNCVSPCTTVKDENKDFYAKADALVNVFKKTIPLGRMGTAVESANVIAFLCSPQASFVTGQQITVDGGVSLLSQESLARKIAGV
jgi:NAD(P)-dependent dehydrogenase (short-subunit alcohol dehydrogenase family)